MSQLSNDFCRWKTFEKFKVRINCNLIYIFNILPIIFLILSFGCKSLQQKNADESKSPDVEIKVKNLSEENAIEKVKYEVRQNNRTIRLRLPYVTSESRNVPCNQWDIDTDPNKNDAFLCKCKPDGSPYGYKKVTEQVSKCCEEKDIHISSIDGKWVAVYSDQSDGWSVSLEFEADKVKKVLSWAVGDKTGSVSGMKEL